MTISLGTYLSPKGDCGSADTRTRSERCPFIPIRSRLEAPRARHSGRAARAARATVWRKAAGARRVIAGSQDQVQVERRRDPREDLEPNAFSQAVLDHGPRPLAHAGELAQTCLCFESQQANVPQFEPEMKDHVLIGTG